MITLTRTYYKGRLKLDKPVKFTKPIKVIVTFAEEVIEERRNAI